MKINQDGEQEEDETFKWMAEKILHGVQTKKPNLDLFDEKITQLNRIKQQRKRFLSTYKFACASCISCFSYAPTWHIQLAWPQDSSKTRSVLILIYWTAF
jgi:hypothetical protein